MELTIIYILTKINEEISHNISEFFQKKNRLSSIIYIFRFICFLLKNIKLFTSFLLGNYKYNIGIVNTYGSEQIHA